MILILGADNPIGQAFATELRARRESFVPLSRGSLDFTRFELLFDYLRRMNPELVINAASYPESPLEGGCNFGSVERLAQSTVSTKAVDRACSLTRTPCAHVTSASVYCGAKIFDNGALRIVTDVTRDEIVAAYSKNPNVFHGFTEEDAPNFEYAVAQNESRTKGFAGESTYVWRLRMICSELVEPWNLLWQLQHAVAVQDGLNSISHLPDCVRACLELWSLKAPFGVYNVANPGPVTNSQLLSKMHTGRTKETATLLPRSNDRSLASARSNCILDTTKLERAGVKIRPAIRAIDQCLKRWPVADPATITTISFSR